MQGHLPLRPWRIKPWAYRVQPGDDLAGIARGLTESDCPCRVEQLLGANLHKDFAGPIGAPQPPLDTCRVVAQLTPGEALFVPLDWPEAPGYMGQRIERFGDRIAPAGPSGRPTMVDPLAPYVGALTNYWEQVVGPNLGVPMPPGISQTDVIGVVAAWFPYLRNYYPPQVPPLPNIVPGSWPMPPVPGVTPPSEMAWYGNLLRAFQQAISFLQNTNCTADIAKMIPWDRIPWDRIPWGEILAWAKRMGWTDSQMWAFLASAMGPAISYRPMSLSMSAAPPDPTNLLETDFSKGAWGEIPFADVLWQSQNVQLLADPAFLACLKENPAQANRIAQCKDCFTQGSADKFKQYICNPQLDPCDCKDDGDGNGGGKDIIVVTDEGKKGSNWPLVLGLGAGILSLAAAAITYGGASREKSR